MRHHFGEATDLASDDHPAGGHRLERRDPEALAQRGQRNDVGGGEAGGDVVAKTREAHQAGAKRRRRTGERGGFPAVAAEDVTEACRTGRQLGGGLEQDRVALPPLERPEDEDHDVVRREAPGRAEALPCPRRRDAGIRVDAARHDPDAVVTHADPQQRLPHALRDRDNGVDGAVVEEAGVGTTRRHVVHPPRDDEPGAPSAAERRERVRPRGVEVDDVMAGDEATERQRRAQVEVVPDAKRHQRHAARRGHAGERSVRMRGETDREATRSELGEKRQHLRFAPAPFRLGVDVQHAHQWGARGRGAGAGAPPLAFGSLAWCGARWLGRRVRELTGGARGCPDPRSPSAAVIRFSA